MTIQTSSLSFSHGITKIIINGPEVYNTIRPETAIQITEAEIKGMVYKVVPLEPLQSETLQCCKIMMKRGPKALGLIKMGLNAKLDGQAGILGFAGNATLSYYLTEEARGEKNALLEKRDPEFKKIQRFP